MKRICVSCIKNLGLKTLAENYAKNNGEYFFNKCGHSGKYLTDSDAKQLAYEFFVRGSIPPALGGNGSVYNIMGTGENDLFFDSELDFDIKLLSQYESLPLCHYGPPLYKIGATTNYQDLVFDKIDESRRKKIWNDIISVCGYQDLTPGSKIFRVRKGDSLPPAIEAEFDSNPEPCEGRFNQIGEHVFYGAFDVETCLHETRVTLTDWIALATFQVKKQLRILDLTNIKESPGTPYESVQIFIDKILYSGVDEYPLCQELSREIKYLGYDGFISYSFFKQAHKENLKNIVLFGCPASDRKIELISTNRIILKYVSYDFTYGPMNDNKRIDITAMKEWAAKQKEFWRLAEGGELDYDEIVNFIGNSRDDLFKIMK